MEEVLVKKSNGLIKKAFVYFTKPQTQMMAELIVALFHVTRFTLRDVSSKIIGEVSVKHKLKRLINFLDKLEVNESYWKSYAKVIFCLPYFLIWRRKYISIILDATTLKKDFWILSGSISCEGRAIPIYLKIWRGVNESYDYWQRVREFLLGLQAILPRKYEYVLVADRGFQGEKMFNLVEELGWKYVIRLYSNYQVNTGNNYKPVDALSDGYYENITLGITKKRSHMNMVVSSKIDKATGEIASWYLATNLTSAEQVVSEYSQRMWIEESFKDLKSEQKWETYTKKIPINERLEKMISISCLSYALKLCIGKDIDVPPSEAKKTSLFKRVQHILVSAREKLQYIYCKLVTLFYRNYGKLQRVYT